MARLILCDECYYRAKKTYAKYGEYCHGYSGEALRPYMCDNGNESISEGEHCWAVNLFATDPGPMLRWHTDYINEDSVQEKYD